MKRGVFVVGLLLLALLGGLLAGCGTITGGKPTPLPTVMLDSPSGSTPAPKSQGGSVGGVVTASGNVAPFLQVQVAASASGYVQAVNVRLGDTVQQGQVLVKLAGSEKLAAAVQAANLELLTAQQALKKLNDGAEKARSDALLRLANAKKKLDDAQKVRTWRNYRNGSDSQIETARADYILANNRLKDAQEFYNAVSDRSEDDQVRAGARSALSAAQNARDRALANLNYLLAMPNALDVEQAEAELQAAKAEVESAQKEVDKLKNGADPDAVALAQERIKNAQAQLAASQAALADLEFKAPVAGTVAVLNLHPGEWVTLGQPALVLVDLSRLQVETTDLSERDVPKVSIGQPAVVTIKALNSEVKGKVRQIAPLSEKLGGDVVYKATIDLDAVPAGLRAGMSVTVSFGGGQ